MEKINRVESRASVPRRSFTSRTFSLKRRDDDGDVIEGRKGPLGLNTLYEPESAASTNLIFVHGLGGGSQSTWTRSSDPSLYWPQEWLPQDPAFRDVRIHSFGYDSNWDKESTLNLHDFSKSLLSSIHDSPQISAEVDVPLIFCGHSMGGLLIKRAYILANQKKEYQPIADRTRTIIFLATPHRGADLAQLFSKILSSVASGPRPFVEDLHRNSPATQSINDEFPQYCQELQLFSFYETLPTRMGPRKAIVVDKDLATLGYANERTAYLNADHRDVARFRSPTDPNYQTLRNSLASAIDSLRTAAGAIRREIDHEQKRVLQSFLGASDITEDDLIDIDAMRMQGSCEWLLRKSSFNYWQESANTQMYWITAKPATGKTVLSGKVIHHLKSSQRDVSFYFFDYQDKDKSNISAFLLSVAWQMGLLHQEVLESLLQVRQKDDDLYRADHRTIWRKLFVECILKIKYFKPQYWVIDGLDECRSENELVPLLLKAVESCSFRVFVTSRNRFESHKQAINAKAPVVNEEINIDDTKLDVALYLAAHMEGLPSIDETERQDIVMKILAKSNGCFLWVRLILERLRQVHTFAEIRQVLEEVPSDMNDLYARILESMSSAPYGKKLAKAILTWTVCSSRTLSVEELHHALQYDMRDKIDNVERAIAANCSQLVYVDPQSRVQLIHQTVRDFLLQPGDTSEFAIDKKNGHKQLAMTCLQYLNGDQLKGPRHRRLSASNGVKHPSPFIAYACTSFYEHIAQTRSTDDDLLLALGKFLSSSNVLAWIAYIAEHSHLHHLTQAGKVFNEFLKRRSKSIMPLGKDVALLESWATDMVRIPTKFGGMLSHYPKSIFHLIPPFCPPESALRTSFASSIRGIAVMGLYSKTWGDCLSTITLGQQSLTALAASDRYFAFGTAPGKIMVYNSSTCQQVRDLRHGETVRKLEFAKRAEMFISAGFKRLTLWATNTWHQVWTTEIGQLCLSLAFLDDERLLLGALRNNHLMVWDLDTGDLKDSVDWTKDLEGSTANTFRRPIAADFCVEQSLLAIVFRGQDIMVWDLERDAVHERYCKESGLRAPEQAPKPGPGFNGVLFSLAPSANLLAASHLDGDLVLFDTYRGSVVTTVVANAQKLACSPDGRTLACGGSSGRIQIFDFESLKLLYIINSDDYGIQELAFSGDSHHLLDIRGSQCRVWDPPVLVRDDLDDLNSDTLSTITRPQEVDLELQDDLNLITSLASHEHGEMFFCGREDGSIYVHDSKSGTQSHMLCSHPGGVSVQLLYFDSANGVLCSTDTASRIMMRKLTQPNARLEAHATVFDHRVGTAVDQVLMNNDCSRLLVCTAQAHTLWSLQGDTQQIIQAIIDESLGPHRWITHPSRPSQIILIDRVKAHIYDWATLQRLTTANGILLEGSILPELAIQSITSCSQGTLLATAFSERAAARCESRLLLWHASDFHPCAQRAAPVPRYQALASEMEILIGTSGPRIVFLRSDGWVCSLDTSKSTVGYARHFFFPPDWLSADQELKCALTPQGDVLFVKLDEVAVIKRGLMNVEPEPAPTDGRPGWKGEAKSSLTVPLA